MKILRFSGIAMMILFSLLIVSLISGTAAGMEVVVLGDDTPESKVYANFYKAYITGDVESIKKYVVEERIPSLDDPDFKEWLEFDRQERPKEINIVKTESTGDSGTVFIEGKFQNRHLKGTISMVKQGGKWKVGKESFSWESK